MEAATEVTEAAGEARREASVARIIVTRMVEEVVAGPTTVEAIARVEAATAEVEVEEGQAMVEAVEATGADLQEPGVEVEETMEDHLMTGGNLVLEAAVVFCLKIFNYVKNRILYQSCGWAVT